jgi:hypothetical protein
MAAVAGRARRKFASLAQYAGSDVGFATRSERSAWPCVEITNGGRAQISPLYQEEKKYLAGTYARTPIHLTRGEGVYMFDHAGRRHAAHLPSPLLPPPSRIGAHGCGGRRYIDYAAGIAVNAFGTGDREWLKALNAQAQTCGARTPSPRAMPRSHLCHCALSRRRLVHTSNVYVTGACARTVEPLGR